ncbi:hypothetical protein D777_02265 [Marinobacter nitratireducens]|uniref:Uncharacterized protein n=1 Tax=Marinobacter nitratireducens TaxID=1137280 RepID=A0A072N1Q9_9GAMM|nr:hypothetical protein D777_02265 [Marinobacter nitratireducens]
MLLGEQSLASACDLALTLVALPRAHHRHPVATLHQALAEVPESIGNTIDFRGKSLGNDANVLLASACPIGLGHDASCVSFVMFLLWKRGMTVMRQSRDIPFTCSTPMKRRCYANPKTWKYRY